MKKVLEAIRRLNGELPDLGMEVLDSEIVYCGLGSNKPLYARWCFRNGKIQIMERYKGDMWTPVDAEIFLVLNRGTYHASRLVFRFPRFLNRLVRLLDKLVKKADKRLEELGRTKTCLTMERVYGGGLEGKVELLIDKTWELKCKLDLLELLGDWELKTAIQGRWEFSRKSHRFTAKPLPTSLWEKLNVYVPNYLGRTLKVIPFIIGV